MSKFMVKIKVSLESSICVDAKDIKEARYKVNEHLESLCRIDLDDSWDITDKSAKFNMLLDDVIKSSGKQVSGKFDYVNDGEDVENCQES